MPDETIDRPSLEERRDAADPRHLAEALRASEERFRQVVDTQTDLVIRYRPDGILTFVNEAYCRHVGKPREELLGQFNDYDLLPPDEQKRHDAYVASLTPERPSGTIELRSLVQDGSMRWEQWHDRAFFDAEGRVIELQGVGRDITERVLAEQALRESQERYRAVVDTQSDMVIRWRPSDRVLTFVNDAFCRFIGKPREALVGRPNDHALLPPEEAERTERLFASLTPDHPTGTIEVRSVAPDGKVRWEQWNETAIFDADGRVVEFQGVGRDITERREMEEALRQSEERLAAFLNHAPVGMYVKDIDGRYRLLNPEMEKVFGRPIAEALGRSAADLFGADEAAMIAGYDREVLQAGRPTVNEEFIPGLDTYGYSLVIRFPISDAGGQIRQIGGFDVDISAHKKAEAEMTRQRAALHQSEKMSALGSLLAGVAHEINNPLAVVVGQARLLEETAADVKVQARAEKIRLAADSCARIVRTFLAMARQKTPEHGPVDLNQVAETALQLIGYALRSAGIEVVKALDPALPPSWGDGGQLTQVVINLIVNAQQAMIESIRPRRLRIATVHDPERQQVRLEVADSGPGVPPDLRSRIFEPFFTTKPVGLGTGIGLSVSHGIVRTHGGRLGVGDTPGGGATFVVELPLRAAEAVAETPIAVAEPVASLAVLVVDDEPEIVETLTEILRGDGHRVTGFTSGVGAAAALASAVVDLVLSDLRMPDLDGPGLYRRLAETRPELLSRIGFITGDTLGASVSGFLAKSRAPYLEKPFSPDEVRAFVARLAAKPLASRRRRKERPGAPG